METAKHKFIEDTFVKFKEIFRMNEALILVEFEDGETTDMTKQRFNELFEAK